MPLFKRREPFALSESPKDMKPDEHVFQVRFTKEIFCDYGEYLNRINLYRQRVWTCKVTGKTNLTYEEALVAEKNAAERVQHLPKELIAPALGIIQFSMLPLKDLADTMLTKLQGCLYVGVELYGKKDHGVFPCKIVKVLEEGAEKSKYEVSWLGESKEIIENTTVNGEDLVKKKLPYSRNFFKSFIRESTYRYSPWVVHNELAQKHGISIDPPGELRNMVSFENGLVVRSKKRRKERKYTAAEDDQANEPLKYPIEDLLVQPGEDDPVFTDCPSPSRDFNIPMDCVGDLLMVWDFCSSFGRLLNLSPFPLEDFENAVCHKDSNLVLIVESHMALLQILINDNGGYFLAIEGKNRKLKITLMKWTEYLCDFIDMINIPELCSHTPTIKRGHYGLLDVNAKLRIFSELVNQALETGCVRRKLDEYIEKQLVLGATRRGEALKEGRKKREEKERTKSGSNSNMVVDGHNVDSPGNNLLESADNNHAEQNGGVEEKGNGEVFPSQQAVEMSDEKNVDAESEKMGKKQKTENMMETVEDHSLKGDEEEVVKVLKGDDKEVLKQSKGDKDHVLKLYNGHKEEALEQLKCDQEQRMDKSTKEQRVGSISREHFEREMEKLFVRNNPLGKDRHYNRYWWFRRDGRIFVESSDSKQWGYYSTKEEFDTLTGSLNCKGEREKALHGQLEKFYSKICSEFQKRSKEVDNSTETEAIVRRSTRVRAPPRENPANAFMRYVNKWKEN